MGGRTAILWEQGVLGLLMTSGLADVSVRHFSSQSVSGSHFELGPCVGAVSMGVHNEVYLITSLPASSSPHALQHEGC